MKRRLELAKELLAEDGVIFISIDDNEQAYLKILMDQIFGEDNFISNLYWIRNPGGQSDNKHIAKTYEFVLIYAKNKDLFEIKDLEKEYDILDYKYDDANKSFWKKGSMLEKSGSNDRLIDRPNLGYVVYYNPKLKKIQIEYNYNKSNINNLTTIKDKIYKFNEKLLEQDYIPIIPRFTKNTYGR